MRLALTKLLWSFLDCTGHSAGRDTILATMLLRPDITARPWSQVRYSSDWASVLPVL